jgi:DNA-binding Lrp family transcriptional regulator
MGEDQHTGDRSHEIPLPVPEAAEALGISPEAVRNRLSRGTLRSIREGGKVLVLIDRDISRHTERHTADRPELVEDLRDQVKYLRDQLEEANTRDRENRRLLAAALERTPELEAPPATPQEAERGVQRPWWRRLLSR